LRGVGREAATASSPIFVKKDRRFRGGRGRWCLRPGVPHLPGIPIDCNAIDGNAPEAAGVSLDTVLGDRVALSVTDLFG